MSPSRSSYASRCRSRRSTQACSRRNHGRGTVTVRLLGLRDELRQHGRDGAERATCLGDLPLEVVDRLDRVGVPLAGEDRALHVGHCVTQAHLDVRRLGDEGEEDGREHLVLAVVRHREAAGELAHRHLDHPGVAELAREHDPVPDDRRHRPRVHVPAGLDVGEGRDRQNELLVGRAVEPGAHRVVERGRVRPGAPVRQQLQRGFADAVPPGSVLEVGAVPDDHPPAPGRLAVRDVPNRASSATAHAPRRRSARCRAG